MERFRVARGSYPSTLDEFIPVFAEAAPNDVVNGASLHSRLNSVDSFLLYSVGANGRDDGARRNSTLGSVVNSKRSTGFGEKRGSNDAHVHGAKSGFSRPRNPLVDAELRESG